MWGLRRAVIAVALACALVSCATEPKGPSPEELARQAALEASRAEELARQERERLAAIPRFGADDMRCLALAIYWEGKSDGRESQAGVAHVVLNRLKDPRFPKTICAVVHEGGDGRRGKCQFSWWCDGKSDEPTNAAQWQEAQRIARTEARTGAADPTNGALYFHQRNLSPSPSNNRQRTATLGDHVFYR